MNPESQRALLTLALFAAFADGHKADQHEQAGHEHGARGDERENERDGGDEGGDDLDSSGAHGTVNVRFAGGLRRERFDGPVPGDCGAGASLDRRPQA